MPLHHSVDKGVHGVDRLVQLAIQERNLFIGCHLSVLIAVHEVFDSDCIRIVNSCVFEARLCQVNCIHGSLILYFIFQSL